MRQLKLYIWTNLEALKHAHKMFTVGSCHSVHKPLISCLTSSPFRFIFLLNSGESSYWQPMTLTQGSRVRPIWSHVHPNFSRVRLTKIPGRTGASSHSRKEKKSIRDSETLCGSTKDTPVRLISWSKPIRDSEGRTPPLIGRGPDIPVCVCARWQMRHVCCCNQRERKRWVVEMRAVLPT